MNGRLVVGRDPAFSSRNGVWALKADFTPPLSSSQLIFENGTPPGKTKQGAGAEGGKPEGLGLPLPLRFFKTLGLGRQVRGKAHVRISVCVGV